MIISGYKKMLESAGSRRNVKVQFQKAEEKDFNVIQEFYWFELNL